MLVTWWPILVFLGIVLLIWIATKYFKHNKLINKLFSIKKEVPVVHYDVSAVTEPEAVSGTEEPQIPQKPQKIYNSIKATVYNNITRALSYETEIPASEVAKIARDNKTLGRQINKDGKYQYAYVLSEDSETKEKIYRPIIMRPLVHYASDKLQFDIDQPEIPVIMDMREEKNFFEKYGQILIWGAIMAFIIFMIVGSKGG
jgi:hypothetical protein